MFMIYPDNPHFEPLTLRMQSPLDWKEAWAHDPSLIETNGMFYAFSTDGGRNVDHGYQIRKSKDLIHWDYVGSAFNLRNSQKAYAKGEGTEAYGNLLEAYRWCLTKKGDTVQQICTRESGEMGFWAPHCIEGSDGKYWLYFCLTGYFGGSKSCIGLAKADEVTGPYTCVGLIVCSSAGWRNPNAIDPQAFYDADGELHLVYGSYGMGLHILDLDKKTGLRKDGFTRADFDAGRCSFGEYYGTNIANGSIEGGVIKYHKDVPVFDRETGTWTKKNFYYLMCSFGSLSTVYNMRSGRSENVHGPYVDVNGNTLVCSTDLGTGNKQMGSFLWKKKGYDYFCPGHNDMLITSGGVNVISYHCRTHFFKPPLTVPLRFRKKFAPFFMFVNQYTFNEDGWLIMNPNRYGGETIQDVTKEDILNISHGNYQMVVFSQDAECERSMIGQKVKLNAKGQITGYYKGTWRLHDGRYIEIVLNGEIYRGVVMPCWIQDVQKPGLTISALGTKSGMPVYLNSSVEKD